LRIVVLTSESLPSNVITETLMREVPGCVVGIVVSTAMQRGVSTPRALWHHARRMGPRSFAMFAGYVLALRALWRLGRLRGVGNLPPGLRKLTAAAAIPLIGTRDINGGDPRSALRTMEPDLLVSIYFNQRIGREVLAVSRAGAINLHPALLPKHRGPAPNFWVAAAGESRPGVTVHWSDAGLDTGALVLQRELEVPRGTSVSKLIGMVVRPGAAALVEAVRLIEAGNAPHQAQDGRAATYDSWPTRDDFRRLRKRGGRYGSAFELVAALKRID
jgi:methionyl-tRNA formyltransferase